MILKFVQHTMKEFIRILKNKIYKYVSAISKKVYIDEIAELL